MGRADVAGQRPANGERDSERAFGQAKGRVMMHRRSFLASAAALSIIAGSANRLLAQDAAAEFSRSVVLDRARALAAAPYAAPPALPEWLTALSAPDHAAIRFRDDRRFFSNPPSALQVDLVHPGFIYAVPVEIFVIEDGQAKAVPYDPDLFSFGTVTPPAPDALPGGFAGLRVLSALNQPDMMVPFASFAGASYFQAISKDQVFGTSARGLAIGTGEPAGEEFPFFRAHWIEPPANDRIVIHSLLDGQSASGAYRFTLRPGDVTQIDVEATIFARDEITHLGLAPLTSMFLFDAKDRSEHDDYRLGVHDADGLAMWNGSDERLWRPLHSPRLLQISAFSDTAPRGFGLIQRDKRFESYEDLTGMFHRKPSVWVEPIGAWGKGHIVLVEIPSNDEVHDNIVAYWRPTSPVPAGSEVSLTYRLTWGWDVPDLNGLLRVVRTLSGSGPGGTRRFVIDFSGEADERDPCLGGAALGPGQSRPDGQCRHHREPRDQWPPPAVRPRSRRRPAGRDAHRPALRRPADLRDMGLPMEQLTRLPAARVADASPPLPPVAPIAMPEQSLVAYDRAKRRRLRGSGSVYLARFTLFGATAVLSAALVRQMWLVLSIGGMTGVEKVMLALFVINIVWVVFGAISPLIGFFLGPDRPPRSEKPLTTRTALLMPTYNEDASRILGAALAMLHDIDARGEGETFDLFLLSDTTQAGVWLQEQALVDAARADPKVGHRLFYRHRSRNLRRKSGNIEDWVTRWGGTYPFMLCLDADSLMEADTIIELARRMEADETLGILQTSPQLIGGVTPLGRVQQFAARVYGPVLTRGLRAWFGNAGNYWGHNAMIRTRAFAEDAGLPELAGKPPFGGLILSHDFVEAAFIRRGGYAVRMADDLRGSYEHAPPNLLELAARDRRWCQGNLQHTRLLRTAGFHPLSRLHLFMGVMSYLSSPLWLLFLLSGMSLALHAALVPPDYFLDRFSLFPDWPRIDPERAMMLFGLCMLVLYLPKLIGTAAFLAAPERIGVKLASIPGLLVEILLSALVAPIMMLVQTSSVIQIITGRDSGWSAQARDSDRVPWAILWRFHRRHMAMGLLFAAVAGAISWRLLAWMSPALVGLVLAVPLSAFMGNARVGRSLARMRLLLTPEEAYPPAIAGAADRAAESLREAAHPPAALQDLLADPEALERHLAWLDQPTSRPRGTPDAALASALLKLDDELPLDRLDAREAYAVLAAPGVLTRLANAHRLAAHAPANAHG